MPQEETKERFGYVLDKNPKYKTPTQSSKAQGLREQLEWIKRQLEYASFAERFCATASCCNMTSSDGATVFLISIIFSSPPLFQQVPV